MNASGPHPMLETVLVAGAAALVLAAILGIFWLLRARAARRFNAAVDAYAEREIDRERRTKGPRWASPQRSAVLRTPRQ